MAKRAVHSGGESVSFFFPAYMDADSLPGLVRGFHGALQRSGRDFEIIIVHDKSPDNTGEVADALARELPKVRVVHNKRNMGYGGALVVGFNTAKKTLVGFTDGDAQFSAADLQKFFDAIKNADIVVGCRVNRADGNKRAFFGKGYRFCLLLLFGLRLRDPDCGFKMMRGKFFAGIEPVSRSGFFSAEMLVKAKKSGLRIKEVPVRHLPRRYGCSTCFGWGKIFEMAKDMVYARLGRL
ncbi:MAG: glycosyltransferase family 2 protein [Candidatus Diapherotrites archaeon]|nr:glycosyltransferase family 2 protein [Candidatus Diapherotrites archaeon]